MYNCATHPIQPIRYPMCLSKGLKKVAKCARRQAGVARKRDGPIDALTPRHGGPACTPPTCTRRSSPLSTHSQNLDTVELATRPQHTGQKYKILTSPLLAPWAFEQLLHPRRCKVTSRRRIFEVACGHLFGWNTVRTNFIILETTCLNRLVR